MLLVWQRVLKDPEHFHERQLHPVLLQTEDPLAVFRALGDHPEWQGRGLYLHPDTPDPRPETALAMVGWGRIDRVWHWVADGPGTHGFLRDTLFDWVERGMQWTVEQRQRARAELVRRNL